MDHIVELRTSVALYRFVLLRQCLHRIPWPCHTPTDLNTGSMSQGMLVHGTQVEVRCSLYKTVEPILLPTRYRNNIIR